MTSHKRETIAAAVSNINDELPFSIPERRVQRPCIAEKWQILRLATAHSTRPSLRNYQTIDETIRGPPQKPHVAYCLPSCSYYHIKVPFHGKSPAENNNV